MKGGFTQMRAIVVDDEVWTLEHICDLVGTHAVEVIGCYTNPLEALDAVVARAPDVVFLDIEMPEMSGLEFAEKLEVLPSVPEVVFITAYNQYAIDAFRVNALDYLLKPVLPADIERTVERVRRRIESTIRSRPEQQPHAVRVSLLGNLAVYAGDSGRPIRWVTAKCGELFAYMMLQNKESERSKWSIIEALWHDKNSEKAEVNFRSTVSRVNKTLREYATGITIVYTGNGYRLQTKDVVIDVDALQLERYVRDEIPITETNVAHIQSLLLHREPALLAWTDGEWREAYAVQYEHYIVHLARRLLHYYERLDAEPLTLLPIIELLIRHHPYEDDYHIYALKLHARIGGKRHAHEYYQAYVELLQQELGEAPSMALQMAYQQLLE